VGEVTVPHCECDFCGVSEMRRHAFMILMLSYGRLTCWRTAWLIDWGATMSVFVLNGSGKFCVSGLCLLSLRWVQNPVRMWH